MRAARPRFDRLGGDEAGAGHEGGAFVELIGDGVVGGAEAGRVDPVGRDPCALSGVAELSDEVHVSRRVDQFELFDRGAPRRQKVAVFDETRRFDQVHRQLYADGLEGMLVGQVMLHQLVAVDEHNRT